MKKVKITVLDTTYQTNIAKEYAENGLTPCSVMKKGQVFYTELAKPDGFCDTAWKCIFQYVFALLNGARQEGFFNGDWIKQPYTAIACCNDGLRPVIFKIETVKENEDIKL